MKLVDARGHHCPVPTLRLRRAIEQCAQGEMIELLADDPMARIDVPHFIREAGHVLLAAEEHEGTFHFRVQKSG